MKKKLDIRINPKHPSGQQIARHKNFDALLKKYAITPKQRPVLRRIMYGAAAAAAALIGVAVLFQVFAKQESYEQQSEQFFSSQPYINPLLKNVKPTFATFTVNANKGGVYEYPSGSKLIVPPAAFSDENGKPVSGEVTLKYHEMHDFVDFFVSGVPMTYDSAGVKYTLESAGMIEMYAEQGGKRVNLSPGKGVNVELVSNVNLDAPAMGVPASYNIYKLDPENRRWEYQDIDRVQVLDENLNLEGLDKNDPSYVAKKELKEQIQSISIAETNEVAKVEKTIPKPKQPIQPQKANGNDYVFDLDFKDLKKVNATGEQAEAQAELAELYKQYEKMLWQLSPSSSVKPQQLQQEFGSVTGISIRKINSRDFELTLQKKDQSLTIIANPVLSASEYEKSLGSFNKEFDVYQKQISDRESLLKSKLDAIKQQFEEDKKLAQLKYEEKIAAMKANGNYVGLTNEIIKKKVVNRFTATYFGIWNCDRPLPPMMAQLKANFKDEKGNKIEYASAYLVNQNFNTVYNFLAAPGAGISFNRNAQNLMWVVLESNKIAIFRPEDFKKIEQEKGDYTFTMQTIDREIKDENDLREILVL